MSVTELREERGRIFERMKELDARADEEKRSLSAEEQGEWDRLHTRDNECKAEIGRKEAIEDRERELAAPKDEIKPGAEEDRETPEDDPRTHANFRVASREDYAEAFDAYLRHGAAGIEAEQRAVLRMGQRAEPGDESRALTVTTTGGGYLIPTGFQAELEEALKAFGGVRSVARVITTGSGNDIHWPAFDDTGNSGELLAISANAGTQDTAYTEVILKAYKYSSKMVKVPIELLQDSAFNVEEHLREALGTRIGRITNAHFTTGTATTQPQGVVVASEAGKTAASATAIADTELDDLFHSVDPAYRKNATWMFEDATLKHIKQLKDAEGRRLWLPSLVQADPDTILGKRYTVNQDMASIAASAKTVLFGDFSAYVVRDVMPFTLLRLEERYAEFGQVAFLAFSRHDGRATFASGWDAQAPIQHLVQAA